MEIACPKCGTDTRLPLPFGITCASCKAHIADGKFDRRTPRLGRLVIVAAATGALSYTIMSSDRYPIATEYALVESCVGNSKRSFLDREVREKRDICMCALEQVQQDWTLDDFEKDRKIFFKTFRTKAEECRAENAR